MARLHLGWRVLTALATLSVGGSIDSVNLDLEVLSQIDLSALGTPNLDRYKADYELTVDSNCQYLLVVEWEKHKDDKPGSSTPEFTGVCEESDNTGDAPDGKPWHAPRRQWMQFPSYVFDTTGFDHWSIYWRPCGLPPKGLRKARFDVTFYTVIPQYRAFWTCTEFRTPRVCSANQTSTFGRGHFVLPRMERDPNFLPNLPVGFSPDPLVPEAYQYEGMFSWNAEEVPETASDFKLPEFDLSTYDGDVVSFRTMLPYEMYSGGNSTKSSAYQFYLYQTMPRLPASWNTTYDSGTGRITVSLTGSAGLCGDGFDATKADQEGASSRRLRG